MENYALFVLKREHQDLLRDMQMQGLGPGAIIDSRQRQAEDLREAINHLLLLDKERVENKPPKIT